MTIPILPKKKTSRIPILSPEDMDDGVSDEITPKSNVFTRNLLTTPFGKRDTRMSISPQKQLERKMEGMSPAEKTKYYQENVLDAEMPTREKMTFEVGEGLDIRETKKARDIIRKKTTPVLSAKDAWEEVEKDPGQLVPFLAGGQEIAELTPILVSANKLQSGAATQEDINKVRNWYEKEQEKAEALKTRGYRVGQILQELPSFAGEILLTGGLATAVKKATIKSGKEFLEKLMKKGGKELLEDAAQKSLKSRTIRTGTDLGLKSTGYLVGELARTPVAGATRIPANTIRKMLPKQINPDEQAEAEDIIVEGGDDFINAVSKAFGEQYVELLSEQSGRLFNKFTKPVKNQLLKSAFIRRFFKYNPNTDVKNFRKLIKASGWNGMIEEMLEERVGDVGHGILYEAGLSDHRFALPSKQDLIDELVAFTLPGVSMSFLEQSIQKGVKPGLTIEERRDKEDTFTQEARKEARKYDSAEEFVEAQGKIVYRKTDKSFDTKLLTEDGLFVSPKRSVAERYPGKIIEELVIDKNAKVLTYKNTPKELYKIDNGFAIPRDNGDGIEIAKYAKSKGYDVVEYGVDPQGLVPESAIVNANIIKTKSQLTDIWKQTKIKEEQKKEEEREAMESALFDEDIIPEFSPELENKYQQFKDLRIRKLEEIEDVDQLKEKLKSTDNKKIEDALYSQEQTYDEVFDVFKEKLLKERAGAFKKPKKQRLEPKEREKLKRKEQRQRIIERYKNKQVEADKIKKELKDYANEHLPLRERGKLLSTIKNAKTKPALAKGVDYIERLEEESTQRELKNKLKGEIKTIKPKGSKPKGKYTPEVQEALNRVRDLVNLSQKAASERLENNLKQGVDNPTENKILDLYTGSSREKQELLEIIKGLKERGEVASSLKKFNVKEQRDRKKNFLINELTGGKGIKEGYLRGDKLSKSNTEKVKQYLKAIGKSTILTWAGKMEALSFNSSVKDKSLVKAFSVLENENKYKKLQSQYIEEFNIGVSSIYGIKNKPISILKKTSELTKETFVIEDREFTRDELIKRYMEFQDPTLYDSFIEGNGYTDSMIKKMENKLTPEDKKFAEWQLDYYKKQYDLINDVYSEMNGVNLPFNEFYSPIRREGIKSDPNRPEFLEEAFYRKAVTNKSLHSRVENLKPIAQRGSLEALDQHVREMNYYVAWSEKIKELDDVFTDPKVRTAIKQEFPSNFMDAIDKHLELMATNNRQYGIKVGWVDYLRKNYAIGNLAAKPALTIKQLTSTVAYAEKISSYDLISGVADFLKNPIKNFKTLQEESVFIKERGAGFERDLKEAMGDQVFQRYKKKRNLANRLLLNVKIGDKGAIVLGSWAMRKKRLKQGWSKQDIIDEYEEFASETQQSADISRLSLVQMGGSLPKLFTMFMSTQRGYLQKEVNAVKSMFRKDGFTPQNIRKVARTLVIYHVVLPVTFQFVANLGGMDEDDKKDYLRAGILGSLNGLFIAGDAIDSVLRTVLGMRVWDLEVPIVDIADDVNKTVGKILKGTEEELSEEEVYSAIDALSSAGTGVSGLPLEYVYDATESLFKGNFDKGMKQVLGWSEYYINDKKEDRIPILPIPSKSKSTLPGFP